MPQLYGFALYCRENPICNLSISLRIGNGSKNGHENCQFYPLECKLTIAFFILGTHKGNLVSIRKQAPLKNKKVYLLIFIFGTPFLCMGY